jgi:hypothetical protein
VPTATAASAATVASPTPIVEVVNKRTLVMSPSGNITCGLTMSNVICKVFDRTWKPPAAGTRCDPQLEFGPNLLVSTSGFGTFYCGTDEPLSWYPDNSQQQRHTHLLSYGHAIRLGQFECLSSRTGMRCNSMSTEHGFSASRSAYRLF